MLNYITFLLPSPIFALVQVPVMEGAPTQVHGSVLLFFIHPWIHFFVWCEWGQLPSSQEQDWSVGPSPSQLFSCNLEFTTSFPPSWGILYIFSPSSYETSSTWWQWGAIGRPSTSQWIAVTWDKPLKSILAHLGIPYASWEWGGSKMLADCCKCMQRGTPCTEALGRK